MGNEYRLDNLVCIEPGYLVQSENKGPIDHFSGVARFLSVACVLELMVSPQIHGYWR